jgi:hypothetical protein
MATTYQVLGQVSLASTTEASLYNVSNTSGAAAVASSLTVANLSTVDLTFRVRVAVGNAASADKQWLFYDNTVYAKSTLSMTLGMTLGQNDYVYVSSTTATASNKLAFNLFGSVLS